MMTLDNREGLMKFLLIALLLASPAFAQDKPVPTFPATAPGCGSFRVKFVVKREKGQHPLADPASGKALVYFIQDDSQYQATPPAPTIRAGLDGTWVGATHGSSYFYVSVDPGVHHVCVSQQGIGRGVNTAAAHFVAKAGESYFFRVKDIFLLGGTAQVAVPSEKFEFGGIDSDEGQLLASEFPVATSRAKN
jgi:uncharacterized protein DUF2846